MDPNPYQPPAADGSLLLLDRAARAALAETIGEFLDERLSAFAFDEALDPFRTSSDPTVRFVADAVWYHYDDCQDHLVALSKPQWDYFQRLLLLLQSDSQVAVSTMRRWSWSQAVALLCLLGFGWCVWYFGWGIHLLAFSIPFGCVSMAISFLRSRRRPAGPFEPILVPFSSFGELAAAWRTTPHFTKTRYRPSLGRRRIRSPLAEFRIHLQIYAHWLLFAPLVLLFQTFRLTETRIHTTPA